MRKPIAVMICILLLCSAVVHGQSEGETIVRLPGRLDVSNNILFSSDGRYGFVAPYYRSEGVIGDRVYSFDTASGEVLDNRTVAFAPTAIVIDQEEHQLVVAGAQPKAEAARLAFVRLKENGRFAGKDVPMLDIEVPMAGDEDWLPDQVLLAGKFAIYTNKRSLYLISTEDSARLGTIVDRLDLVSDYSETDRIINIDYHKGSNLLAVTRQYGADSSRIELFKIDTGSERIEPLPDNPTLTLEKGEMVALGSNIAFSDTGDELFFVTSTTGTLYQYTLSLNQLEPRAVYKVLAEDDVDSARGSVRRVWYQRISMAAGSEPRVLIARTRGIQKPGDIKKPKPIQKPGDVRANVIISTNPINNAIFLYEAFTTDEQMSLAVSSDGSRAYVALSGGAICTYSLLYGEKVAEQRLADGAQNITLAEQASLIGTASAKNAETLTILKVK